MMFDDNEYCRHDQSHQDYSISIAEIDKDYFFRISAKVIIRETAFLSSYMFLH